jgi:hypothetical protein
MIDGGLGQLICLSALCDSYLDGPPVRFELEGGVARGDRDAVRQHDGKQHQRVARGATSLL